MIKPSLRALYLLNKLSKTCGCDAFEGLGGWDRRWRGSNEAPRRQRGGGWPSLTKYLVIRSKNEVTEDLTRRLARGPAN